MLNDSLRLTILLGLSTAFLLLTLPTPVDAGPRAAGHARNVVNRPAAQPIRPSVSNRRTTVNNRSVSNSGNRVNIDNSRRNVNVNRQRDVDIDIDGHGRWGYDDDYHPIATAAAVTATVAVTSAVIGAIVRPSQMPSNCAQVQRNGYAYLQCGSTWYQPQYQGSDVVYVVVNAP